MANKLVNFEAMQVHNSANQRIDRPTEGPVQSVQLLALLKIVNI